VDVVDLMGLLEDAAAATRQGVRRTNHAA